jgi:tRNA_anti-like
MKQRKIRTWAIALVMGLCVAPLAPATSAQNQNPSAQQPAAPQAQNVQKTYYGKIVKLQGGKFGLLINADEKRGYFLDNQKAAKQYADKNALVTGTVDSKTGVLHVVKIKPMP